MLMIKDTDIGIGMDIIYLSIYLLRERITTLQPVLRSDSPTSAKCYCSHRPTMLRAISKAACFSPQLVMSAMDEEMQSDDICCSLTALEVNMVT